MGSAAEFIEDGTIDEAWSIPLLDVPGVARIGLVEKVRRGIQEWNDPDLR